MKIKYLLFILCLSSSFVLGGDRLDKIASSLPSKTISKSNIIIDQTGRFHVVYTYHEIKDGYDYVDYYILDANGKIVKRNNLAKYIIFPDYVHIGVNAQGESCVSYLLYGERQVDEDLLYYSFDRSGNLKKQMNFSEKAVYYSASTDLEGQTYILAGRGSWYWIAITDAGGNIITKKEFLPKGLAWTSSNYEIEILDKSNLLLVWIPRDFTFKTHMIGYCTFNIDRLTFSPVQEANLRDVAEDTLEIGLELKSPELFRGRDNIFVFTTEKKETQVGPTYKIRFDLKGEIVRNAAHKSQRIKKISSQSKDQFILRYDEVKERKGADSKKKRWIYGVDPNSGNYYIEK